MDEKKYIIPKEMATAYQHAVSRDASTFAGLEAAIRWLAENGPDGRDCSAAYEEAMQDDGMLGNFNGGWNACATWYQKRYLAPVVPEELADLQWSPNAQNYEEHNEDVLEAYRRGKQGNDGGNR